MDPLLTLLRLAGSLVVILALAVVLLRWVVPRLPGFRPRAGSRLEVLEVRPLDRQSKVVLLRVDDREIVAAFGAAGVTRLDGWTAERPEDEVLVEEVLAEEAPSSVAQDGPDGPRPWRAPALAWIGSGAWARRDPHRPPSGDGAA